MDVIDQLVGHLHQESCFFCRLHATEPWRITKAQSPVAPFYLVLSGAICVTTASVRHELAKGDFLVLPRGEEHEVSGEHSKNAPSVPLLSLFAEKGILPWKPGMRYRAIRLEYGGSGEPSVLLIGLFHFGAPRTHPLLAALPPTLVLRSTDSPSGLCLQAVNAAIAAELEEDLPGISVTVSKFADLVFAQTLRTYLATEIRNPEGWVRGIVDPIVGAALSAMHSAPQRSWTLQKLAQEAGCSRAAFAKRFGDLMQQSALSYLTSWRMNLAAGYLRERKYTIAEVADRVGYSKDAFAAAFKRWSGQSPKRFSVE